jgi:hypothetical protein
MLRGVTPRWAWQDKEKASPRQLSSKTKAGLGRADWAKADDLKLGVLVNKYNGVNWDQV